MAFISKDLGKRIIFIDITHYESVSVSERILTAVKKAIVKPDNQRLEWQVDEYFKIYKETE